LKEAKILAARGPWPIDRSGRAIWKQRMRQKEYVWTGDDEFALVDALRGSPRSEEKPNAGLVCTGGAVLPNV